MPQVDEAEKRRIEESRTGAKDWRRWGPYLSERQWGTVREDYSPYGTAWDYFSHDQSRSRAYRWGEDGLAGFSDDRQLLCLSLALWNGHDPILKERLFGLTNEEGNHGEDVKEIYYYLDAVPSYAYARQLYKLPQAAYPYEWLLEENARRKGSAAMEFELIDTGIFDDDRYFDVDVEYAKADADDVLMRVTVHNRGPDPAPIHILPQVWFRNTWSWSPGVHKPSLQASGRRTGAGAARGARHLQHRIRSSGSPAVLRQRVQFRAGVRHHLGARPLQGRVPRLRRPRPDRGGERSRQRHQGRRALPADGSGPQQRDGPGPAARRRSTQPAHSSILMTSSAGASPRPTSSTPPDRKASTTRTCAAFSARPSPGCCGTSSSTISTCGNG